MAPLEDEGRPVSSGAVRAALTEGKVVEAAEFARRAPGLCRARSFTTATSAAASSVFRPPTCGSIRPAASSTASTRCVSASATCVTTASPASGCGRCSTAARRCWKCFCSTSTAISTGQAIEVALIGWLRPEQKLESVEALKRQMKTDAAQARDALKRAGKAFPKLGEV